MSCEWPGPVRARESWSGCCVVLGVSVPVMSAAIWKPSRPGLDSPKVCGEMICAYGFAVPAVTAWFVVNV